MDRRGFIGKLLAGVGGLALGQTVQVVKADEKDLKALDVLLNEEKGEPYWIQRIEPIVYRAYPCLQVEYRGTGVPWLYTRLIDQINVARYIETSRLKEERHTLVG